MRRGRGFIAALALAIVVGITGGAQAATIDFDGFAGGAPITNQYQSFGVIFSSNSGDACHTFDDPAEATSDPNILVGINNFSDIFATFVDPASGAPSPIAGGCVNLKVISAGASVVHLRSRNVANVVLEDFVVTHPEGPTNGFQNVDPITFTVGPISTIEMVFTLISPSDGIGIDDFAIEGEGCTTPTRAGTWGSMKSLYH